MKRLVMFSLLLTCFQWLAGQTPSAHKSPWPILQPQMRPWTRWWWMGNAVDEKNLAAALTSYAQAGLGGVEVTPIYGAKGFENRYIDFLSPKWMHMLDYTVQRAAAVGLGVDMNTGTGWPFGGPQVSLHYAASKMLIQQYKVAAGGRLEQAILVNDPKQLDAQPLLQAVTAYTNDGKVFSLLDSVDAKGRLNWTSPGADATLIVLFAGRTLQKVKRAAPGGQGYTLDHLDAGAVDHYLSRFSSAFAGSTARVRAFFNDSYEVYGANWTPSLLQEFKRLRGYDLGMYLRELTTADSTSALSARVKSDYRETMSTLLLRNFTLQWTNWTHQQHSISRNQSHGSPGNLLDLYAAVDIPETEIFGSSHFAIPGLRRDSAAIRNVDPDPMMSKFASSAAHVKGRTLVSSETFTWLTEHFQTSYAQAKPEAEQLFLSGVNHIFFHGTTYSPADIPFPGWLFYAATNMVPANSLWPHLRGMNDYLSRCQSLLQAGKSDNELLIYWPVYDQWAKPKGIDMSFKVHDVNVWLHPTAFYQQSVLLKQRGYAFDFVSDTMLEATSVVHGRLVTSAVATPYRTLLVPACKFMPLHTLQQLLKLAHAGATVIFQQLPEDVPGLSSLDSNRRVFNAIMTGLVFDRSAGAPASVKVGSGKVILAADLPAALSSLGMEGEPLVKTGLEFIRRKLALGTYYYLVNHTAKRITTWLPLNSKSDQILLLDPLSGDYGRARVRQQQGRTFVKVDLDAGETLFLQTGTIAAAAPWFYLGKAGKPVVLEAGWTLRFTAGGPQLPRARKLQHLGSWTATGDSTAAAFSGSAVYSNSFVLPRSLQKEYLLNLGAVDESAHVWINGKDVGFIWSIPYSKRIGKFLLPGKNTIRVEVVNLMANRIRYMDRHHISWRNYQEINFVNIDYKPFDAALWKVMPSGLLGPVSIIPYGQ